MFVLFAEDLTFTGIPYNKSLEMVIPQTSGAFSLLLLDPISTYCDM